MRSGPIFVRGMSRSGGTLMATLLDAHEQVAMSYELYPSLLEIPDPSTDGIRAAIQGLDPDKWRKSLKTIDDKNFRTFVARLPRGGLQPEGILDLFANYLDAGSDFSTIEERLRFLQTCGQLKASHESKQRWGTKISGGYEDLAQAFPDCTIINMVRDGRDVLSSMLHTGSFKRTPAEVGNSWSKGFHRFVKFAETGSVSAINVRYEELVTDSEKVLRGVCEGAGLEFSDRMLRHTELDLTIFNVSHLSGPRLAVPIDASSIGRWKRDLEPAQLAEYMAEAADTMAELGYLD